MPETRYVREYTYPKDLPASEKTLDKATIVEIPYEVSDEELEAELEAQAREEVLKELTAKKLKEIKAR